MSTPSAEQGRRTPPDPGAAKPQSPLSGASMGCNGDADTLLCCSSCPLGGHSLLSSAHLLRSPRHASETGCVLRHICRGRGAVCCGHHHHHHHQPCQPGLPRPWPPTQAPPAWPSRLERTASAFKPGAGSDWGMHHQCHQQHHHHQLHHRQPGQPGTARLRACPGRVATPSPPRCALDPSGQPPALPQEQHGEQWHGHMRTDEYHWLTQLQPTHPTVGRQGTRRALGAKP
jgi:hypothetical protein